MKECWDLVIFTRISWPIQEKDAIRVAAQQIANKMQNIKTTIETMVISPRSGRFTVFCPESLHFLFKTNKSENAYSASIKQKILEKHNITIP